MLCGLAQPSRPRERVSRHVERARRRPGPTPAEEAQHCPMWQAATLCMVTEAMHALPVARSLLEQGKARQRSTSAQKYQLGPSLVGSCLGNLSAVPQQRVWRVHTA